MRWWRQNFLLAESLLSVLVSVMLVIWIEFGAKPYVETILLNNRSAIYSTLAAIFGALLGFVITAASIVLGYSENEKLEVLTTSKYYPQLWQVFKSNIRVLGLATLVSLYSLITATNDPAIGIVVYLNLWILVLVLFRLARAVWVFENIITLVTTKKRTT